MSELYELPKGWEWKKLGSLTKTTSGGTPKRNNKAFWQGNIGWLKSGELNDGYVTEVEEFITEEGLKKSSAKLFPKGTLLIAMYGATVGKLAILDIETTTNQAICGVLNDKKLFDTRFMFFYFRNIRAKMLIDSTGGAQPNLSQTYIKNLDIPLPPLQEQNRIVAKLDSLFAKIDQAIALHQQNIDEAEGFMGSVLNEVFGELEGEYEKTTLYNLATFQNGFAFKSKEFNTEGKGLKVIRIGNVLDLDKNPVYIDERTEFNKYLLREKDIVISMTGTRTKKDYLFVRIVDTNDSYLNQRVGKITYTENSDHNFLYYYLQSSSFRNKIFTFETGAVNQGNISGKDIMNSKIVDAPLHIQQKTVQYLDQLSQKTETLKQVQTEKMESLKALKASILDQAFRGEI